MILAVERSVGIVPVLLVAGVIAAVCNWRSFLAARRERKATQGEVPRPPVSDQRACDGRNAG